ncbi:MAG TPA: chemotaxis protein CheW [Anaeromyxobacteraceae bacterium]|nr:chemotaxis protein CheW [Anaeromyxobacteraceae bacterium]
MTQAIEAAQRTQYLSFELRGVEYGVGILGVKEILQYEAITPVPSMPRSVRGVINLRGSVVPVIDLAAKFGKGETPVTRRTCILIVEVPLDGQPAVMGLMADAVREVIELGPEEIEPPPPFGTRVKVEFLVGVGKAGPKRFVLLLDVERVVTTDEKELAARAAALDFDEPLASPAEPDDAAATPPPEAPPAPEVRGEV